MEKLKELVELCGGGFSLDVNPQKDVYQDAEYYMANDWTMQRADIAPKIRTEMTKRNSIIRLIVNPNPVAFYTVYHYDLEAAIDEALDCIKNNP